MMKHEEKFCPRCKAAFECKVGSVALCQCQNIKLSETEHNYIRSIYTDCLCANCILEMRTEFNVNRSKSMIKKIFGLR
jgi:hypothetical protein